MSNNRRVNEVRPPEGFTEVSADFEWWDPKDRGEILMGKIKRHFTVRDERRGSKPAVLVTTPDGNRATSAFQVTSALEGAEPGTAVWIWYGGKEPLDEPQGDITERHVYKTFVNRAKQSSRGNQSSGARRDNREEDPFA